MFLLASGKAGHLAQSEGQISLSKAAFSDMTFSSVISLVTNYSSFPLGLTLCSLHGIYLAIMVLICLHADLPVYSSLLPYPAYQIYH